MERREAAATPHEVRRWVTNAPSLSRAGRFPGLMPPREEWSRSVSVAAGNGATRLRRRPRSDDGPTRGRTNTGFGQVFRLGASPPGLPVPDDPRTVATIGVRRTGSSRRRVRGGIGPSGPDSHHTSLFSPRPGNPDSGHLKRFEDRQAMGEARVAGTARSADGVPKSGARVRGLSRVGERRGAESVGRRSRRSGYR